VAGGRYRQEGDWIPVSDVMASPLVQDSVSDQTLPSSAVRQNRALSSVLSENACVDPAQPQKDTISQLAIFAILLCSNMFH
jgi:hypothetical protein